MTATKTRTAKTTAPAEEPAPPADPAALVEAVRERQARLLAAYEALVRQVATGTQADADEATRVVTAAGKLPDDLAADIEAHRRRLELRAQADGLEAVTTAMADITARQGELDGRRAAALAGFDQEAAELSHQRDAAVEALRAAKDAERRLRDTCGGPRRDRLQRAAKAAERAAERASTARSAVADVTRLLEQVRAEPGKYQDGEEGRLVARLARAEATVRDTEAEVGRLSAERTEAYAACLQP